MKKYIFLLLSALTLLSAKAESYTYLNFVNSDATITQVGADGLKIIFSDGNAVVTVGEQVTTLALSDLDYMEFTNTKDYGPISGIMGDVDGDEKVDVADVNAVINIILKTKAASDYPGQADVDNDGKVDVSDVNAIINIILKV
ncbi:MAG: dockerin type I repeat-containing protein [Muribaculaceae bacterium]|nr:dockerin type I repeat-containing protein [Muribaculaceae bacterium]